MVRKMVEKQPFFAFSLLLLAYYCDFRRTTFRLCEFYLRYHNTYISHRKNGAKTVPKTVEILEILDFSHSVCYFSLLLGGLA